MMMRMMIAIIPKPCSTNKGGAEKKGTSSSFHFYCLPTPTPQWYLIVVSIFLGNCPWSSFHVLDPWSSIHVLDPWSSIHVLDPWSLIHVLDPWSSILDPLSLILDPCPWSLIFDSCPWSLILRCELVSANVTRLRPTTSCSRDPVMMIHSPSSISKIIIMNIIIMIRWRFVDQVLVHLWGGNTHYHDHRDHRSHDDHGLPAHSHHDKNPLWWEFVRNEHGGNILPLIIMMKKLGSGGSWSTGTCTFIVNAVQKNRLSLMNSCIVKFSLDKLIRLLVRSQPEMNKRRRSKNERKCRNELNM